jgi:flagella basal body P-ring formation protein FlgA
MRTILLAAIFMASLALAGPQSWATGAGVDDNTYPVPRTTIYPGDAITRDVLEPRSFRFRKGVVVPYVKSAKELVGMVARRTLLPGKPIARNSLRERDVIQRGQTAHIIFQAGSLTISGYAKAMEPGSVGDIIALRNVDSGTVIRGQVRADGSIQLGVN